jgi:ABC-type lipoprotein release transport system permease subunit
MRNWVSAIYAFRSLFRHTRRSLLSVIGVGVGCSIGMFSVSWIAGGSEMQVRAASESGSGHLRIVPAGWTETREDTMRLDRWEDALAVAEALPGVEAIALRAISSGLLGLGNRTAGVALTGVAPDRERAANRIVRKAHIEGRYLNAASEGEVVLGRGLAKRLDARVGDDLYLTLAGREEITGAMLRVVGIAETGSRDIDASFCHVHWKDIERWTGYPGLGEISILLSDPKTIDRARAWLRGNVPGNNEIITWREVNPAIAANIAGDRAFTAMLIVIILVVVSLGIASAQLTAVLERHREFGILSALGMKAHQIVSLVLLESVTIGLGGGVVSLLLGGGSAYLLSTKGINLAAMMGGDASFGGVLLDPYLYGSFGSWVVWYAFGVSLCTTVVASLYPAWQATRVNPAEAVRMA